MSKAIQNVSARYDMVAPPRFYPNKSYLDGAIENQLPATIFGSTANAVFFASKFGVLN